MEISALGSRIQRNVFAQFFHGFVALVSAVVQVWKVAISIGDLSFAIRCHRWLILVKHKNALKNSNFGAKIVISYRMLSYVFRAIVSRDENGLRITCTVPGFRSALSNSIDVIPIGPGCQDVELTITSGKSFTSPAFSGSGSKLDKKNQFDILRK